MILTKIQKTFLAAGVLSIASHGFAAQSFFQCGPDEGGCRKGKEQFCLCIPADETFSDSPFCLNFDDDLSCTAVANAGTTCPAEFTFQNQGECLAVLYHSVIKPACKLVSKEKCQSDKSYFCDASGDPLSCHR